MFKDRRTFLLRRRIPEPDSFAIVGRGCDQLPITREYDGRDNQRVRRPFQVRRTRRRIKAPDAIRARSIDHAVVGRRRPNKRPHILVNHCEGPSTTEAIPNPDIATIRTRQFIALWGKNDRGDGFNVPSKRPRKSFARRDTPHDDRRIPAPADDSGHVVGERETFHDARVGRFAHFLVCSGVPEGDPPLLPTSGYPSTVVGDGHGRDGIPAINWGADFARLCCSPCPYGSVHGPADKLVAVGQEPDRVYRACVAGEYQWLWVRRSMGSTCFQRLAPIHHFSLEFIRVPSQSSVSVVWKRF